jgi:hypothetical protein
MVNAMIGLGEVKDPTMLKDNGNFEAAPMIHHLRLFKGFLFFTIG